MEQIKIWRLRLVKEVLKIIPEQRQAWSLLLKQLWNLPFIHPRTYRRRVLLNNTKKHLRLPQGIIRLRTLQLQLSNQNWTVVTFLRQPVGMLWKFNELKIFSRPALLTIIILLLSNRKKQTLGLISCHVCRVMNPHWHSLIPTTAVSLFLPTAREAWIRTLLVLHLPSNGHQVDRHGFPFQMTINLVPVLFRETFLLKQCQFSIFHSLLSSDHLEDHLNHHIRLLIWHISRASLVEVCLHLPWLPAHSLCPPCPCHLRS